MNLHKDDFGFESEPPRRRRSVVGPVFLIALGIVFLLNNLGWLSWDIWSALIRLWPVWLIAAGLDILFGRRTAWGRWVILGVVLTVLAGAVVYFPVIGRSGAEISGDQIAAEVGGAKRAVVSIQPGVGELRVGAHSSQSLLVDGKVWRIVGSRLVRDVHNEGDTLVYSLRNDMVDFPFFFDGGRQGEWDIRLNPDVPTDLRLGTGVGQATLDLRDLTLTVLRIDTGVGESTVTLPGHGSFRAELNTGIGATTIHIPKGMAARIRFSTGIGASSVSGDYVKRAGLWESPNWDSAVDRVEIHVSGGIGEIRVRQMSN